MDKYKVIIHPEVSEDAVELCRQLRRQATFAVFQRGCGGGSDCVDKIEHRAAIVIEALIRKLTDTDDNMAETTECSECGMSHSKDTVCV